MTVWRLRSCTPISSLLDFDLISHGHSMEYDFMRHGNDGYTISISFHFFLEFERDNFSWIGLLRV